MYLVYFNKFGIAVAHLLLIIFCNDLFTWISLVSSNTQSQRTQLLTLFADLKQSLKMSSQILSVYKGCLKRNFLNHSRTVSLKEMTFFSWNLL